MDDKPQIICFHLPQFHSIPENDKWWGKGFTEWNNTRSAKKLFRSHYQPRIPRDGYYDLSKKESIIYEMNLASKYNIDGFCYYHYWFNGKLLLEKPLEIMRELNERIPYFFCWANETWKRTWDGSMQILLEQDYGNENDWNLHFEYLLRFFSDEKYIKIDNKPVFVLYGTKNIKKLDEMLKCWNDNAVKHGFNGLYIVEEKNCFQNTIMSGYSNAFLEFEPMFTISYCRSFFQKTIDRFREDVFNSIHKTNLKLYSYHSIWKNIINRKNIMHEGKKCYYGAFIDWDNTPRKGKNGLVILGANPQKFERYLAKLYKKAKNNNISYIFINAWNEWGEGTYLEPDTIYEEKYLEAIKNVCENQ